MSTRIPTIICALTLLLSPLIGRAAAISPSTFELSSVRGQEVEASFAILNTSASEQVYFLDLLEFTPTEETGTPQFAQKDSEDGLTSWIHFPIEEIPVPAQSRVDVPFNILVPDDVPSGGYYASITVSTAPTDVVATNGAIIEARTAILLFLTNEGETVESLQLLDFTGDQNQTTLPYGTFTFRLQNQGNVHVTPSGVIRLRGMFGNTIATLDANSAEGRVLPASTRAFTVEYQEEASFMEAVGFQLSHLIMGPVTAELTLSYGMEGAIATQTAFWVFPWQLISVLVGGVLLLAVMFKWLQKASK